MEYQQFVDTELRPRTLAALNGFRDALIAAGVAANRITVQEVDHVDLRWRITATRGSRTLIGYVELSDTKNLGQSTGESRAVLTVWLEGNGTEITHSYTVGLPQGYTTEEGIAALLAKLAEFESKLPEMVNKARAFLA